MLKEQARRSSLGRRLPHIQRAVALVRDISIDDAVALALALAGAACGWQRAQRPRQRGGRHEHHEKGRGF